MNEEFELNRLEFMILETLYEFGSMDRFHGLTISEILLENEGSLGARMTVYKKMKKLPDNGSYRFDVISILGDEITWYKNAFPYHV